MRVWWLLILSLLVAGPVAAQNATPTVTAGVEARLRADHDGANTAIYRLRKNGEPLGSDVIMGAAYVGGVVTVPFLLADPGTYQLTLCAVSQDGQEACSAPLSVIARAAAPTPPTNLRLVVDVALGPDGTVDSVRLVRLEPR